MYVYLYINMYIYIYIYNYVCIYTEREREKREIYIYIYIHIYMSAADGAMLGLIAMTLESGRVTHTSTATPWDLKLTSAGACDLLRPLINILFSWFLMVII